ncbi:MAG: hypothetical protein OEW00_00910, partial [candidate division Zixibacteria bacterium]|nr:hypothetical protein [candidate division Zixibacteria bacterium]
SSLISRQRLFNMPLWLAEGYAEYSSRHGWDYFSDMYVRDATIAGYLTPPEYIGGFLAYKQGQAMMKYIADKYGEDKLGDIFKKGKAFLTINKALKESIGIDQKKLWEEFSKEMKRRYWPEIALRKEASEIGKQLTKAREDGSYFNEQPAFSPEGDRLAMYTDKSDYTEIVMISAIDGESIARLVKAERSSDLESLHSFVSGFSFSPDGSKLVFVAKSKGREAICFFDVRERKIYKKRSLDYYNILSPAWSPDGGRVAFSALRGHRRDLFIYHIEQDSVEQLTDDNYDDMSASWVPGTDLLVFSSDREHPRSYTTDTAGNPYVGPGAYMPGDFRYGWYNLFKLDLSSGDIRPLDFGGGNNSSPKVSPDGKKVAFISNRNGIDNIYIGYLDSARYYAVTDILTGVRSLSWSPDGGKIAFAAFNKGVFDIFILKDIVPQGELGVLAPTDYMRGKYDLLRRDVGELAEALEKPDSLTADSARPPEEPGDDYATYEVDPADLQARLDSTVVDSAAAASDSTLAQTPPKNPEDSTITETGVYDDEFVFVSDRKNLPYDDYLVDVAEDSSSRGLAGQTEPAHFDSVAPPLPGGEYQVRKYKVRFTPDYVGGGFSYDTFFGVRGQTFFVFSDYLGNHQIILATDLVNTIDQSNVQAYYFYNRKRINLGVGLFHTKNFYIDNNDFLFSDRFFGFQMLASRPSSKFSRFQFVASQYFINRQYHDLFDPRVSRSTKVTTGELAYVTDNIIWGITGPVNGRRSKIAVSGGINFFDANDLQFYSAEFDYRKYWHFFKNYSVAVRFAGGASFGKTPKLYFLGGTTNWIGDRTLDARVYEVENLYFSDVVTPLRGFPYYDMTGDRYGLINWEFRFPMIDYFAMRFPLPLQLSRVQGVVFTDMGAAWFGSDFKGGTSQGGNSRLVDIKTGFGFGMRANLGFLVLRYDLAWSTDFDQISDKPSYYFSFGADF